MPGDGALQDEIVDADGLGFVVFIRFEHRQWRAEAWLGQVMVWSDDLGPIAPMSPDNAMAVAKEAFGEAVASLLRGGS